MYPFDAVASSVAQRYLDRDRIVVDHVHAFVCFGGHSCVSERATSTGAMARLMPNALTHYRCH